MSSIADQLCLDREQREPNELWASAEVFANHPRVRRVHYGDRVVTVHRYGDHLPAGIGTLRSNPALEELAGLRLVQGGFYFMNFIEGELLDSITPQADLVGSIVDAMNRLWRFSSRGLGKAVRERPVTGPITRGQYVAMPDAVLTSAHEYGPIASEIRRILDARRPGSAVVHGDLKADNVVRATSGEIRFIDWECCGAGHPEDDVASLLASLCVYGLGRAVRRATDPTRARSLVEYVADELCCIRRFSSDLLGQIRQEAPHVSTEFLGHAFLLSCLCRLQGLLFAPSSEAVRLAVTEFLERSITLGPDAAYAWLHGYDSPAEMADPQ